jgi:hypothetical protein
MICAWNSDGILSMSTIPLQLQSKTTSSHNNHTTNTNTKIIATISAHTKQGIAFLAAEEPAP